MTDSIPGVAILTDELLARIRSRAAGYDAANAFFTEDFDELVAAGYLKAFVPGTHGGLGLSVAQVAREQQRLAGAAPATALAVNMHLVWTGVAKVLHDRGDSSLDFVLREAGEGEVFGFGVSEAGNDLVLFGSTTDAAPQPDGGYRFTGTKVFTSLSPAWTKLGTMGLDSTSADAPKIVWGFVDRGDGIEVGSDWDTVGMRASQSNSTRLVGALAPADRIVRRLDPGPNPDGLLFGIFTVFEILLASVYTGIGQRALEIAVETVKKRMSLKSGKPYSQDPDIRFRLASAAIEQDALAPQIHALASDLDHLVNHGGLWFAKVAGLKVRATETAREVVDKAIRVSGGSSYSSSSELGRLYRDVLAGLFHPSDDESAHSTVAAAWLGPLA